MLFDTVYFITFVKSLNILKYTDEPNNSRGLELKLQIFILKRNTFSRKKRASLDGAILC